MLFYLTSNEAFNKQVRDKFYRYEWIKNAFLQQETGDIIFPCMYNPVHTFIMYVLWDNLVCVFCKKKKTGGRLFFSSYTESPTLRYKKCVESKEKIIFQTKKKVVCLQKS